ncbi:GNAT family N-acetyltransferase [Dickeya oryzae]
MRQPTLTTEHLLLRPLQASDVTDVCALLNSTPDISAMTMLIPYPCPRETVANWITDLHSNWEQRKGVAYAICLSQNQQLIGSISLVALDTAQPEIGYWLSADFRRRGLSTEASRALCQFAFSQLGIAKNLRLPFAAERGVWPGVTQMWFPLVRDTPGVAVVTTSARNRGGLHDAIAHDGDGVSVPDGIALVYSSNRIPNAAMTAPLRRSNNVLHRK